MMDKKIPTGVLLASLITEAILSRSPRLHTETATKPPTPAAPSALSASVGARTRPGIFTADAFLVTKPAGRAGFSPQLIL